ncbi:MAG: hypothetical protein AAGH64_03340 [Planctomycetota bacterium]
MRFEDVRGWIDTLYPRATPIDGDALALAVFAQSEGYRKISGREREALAVRAARAAVAPTTAIHTFVSNGVVNPVSSTNGVWPRIRSEIGSPTLAHASTRHWVRAALYAAWMVMVVALHIALPRWCRGLARARHRAWTELVEERW